MAYNTKNVITDLSSLKPAPQYFNTTADAYEVVQGAFGAPRAMLYDVNGNPLFTAANPGNVQLMGSNVADTQILWTPGMLFNETTSDKPRGNTQGTLLASGTRTTTAQSPNQTNYNSKGLIAYLNVTAVPVAPGSGGLKVKLAGFDPVSGTSVTYNIDPANIQAIGIYTYMLYPGISSTNVGTNVQQTLSLALPRIWYVWVFHGDAQTYTYSLGYSLIL